MAKQARSKLKRKVVVAEEFRLVNERGKRQGVLSLNNKDEPRLLLFDKRGKLRISIYLDEGQVGLELLDKRETVRASLGIATNGQPSLQLHDRAERVHASLEMGLDDNPGLDLYDKTGNLRASLSLLGKEPIPNLAVIDRNGKRHRVHPRDYNSDAALAFYDESEEGLVMVGPGPWESEE